MFRIELALGLSYLTISPNLIKSTGLVVMGGDSCDFKSRRRLLEGHNIFHIYLL